MHKKLFITYTILIVLTVLGSLLSGLHLSKIVVLSIVAVAIAKFLTVAMQFMELKEAHNFWKVLLFLYTGLITIVFIILL
jgi:hypothetical protein